VLPLVVAFVSSNITSANWRARYAAVLSLGTITEGPDKPSFNQILVPSINQLISMYGDPSIKVREAISWVMSKVCEHHADVVTQTPEITSLFI